MHDVRNQFTRCAVATERYEIGQLTKGRVGAGTSEEALHAVPAVLVRVRVR